MSNLTTFLKTIKKKAALGAVGATLVLTPGGIALAHGNNHQDESHRSQSQSRHAHFDNDKHKSAKQKSCEERQAKVDQKITEFKDRAQKRYNGISAYLGDQQGLVKTNNLDIDKYDKLNDKAVKIQARASEALQDLQSPTINCNRSAKNDWKKVFSAEQEVRDSINKFESTVQKLSNTILDQISLS